MSVNSCTDTTLLPVVTSINSGTEKILAIIDGIETGMQTASGGNRFSTVPYNDFLRDGAAARDELTLALSEYSAFLSDVMPAEETAKVVALLDPAVYFPANVNETDRISFLSGLHMLKLLKNGILTAEAYAIAAVLQK